MIFLRQNTRSLYTKGRSTCGPLVSMRIKEMVVDALWTRPRTNVIRELLQRNCGNLKIEFIPKHRVGSGTPLHSCLCFSNPGVGLPL